MKDIFGISYLCSKILNSIYIGIKKERNNYYTLNEAI